MLSVLAKNPIFAANPACLADFVKTLVQPECQSIPTPMSKAAEAASSSTPVKTLVQPECQSIPAPLSKAADTAASSPTPVASPSGEASEQQAIEARKQFWSKFKRSRPCPSDKVLPTQEDSAVSPDAETLLALPTLVLGDDSEVPDDAQQRGSQCTMPGDLAAESQIEPEPVEPSPPVAVAEEEGAAVPTPLPEPAGELHEAAEVVVGGGDSGSTKEQPPVEVAVPESISRLEEVPKGEPSTPVDIAVSGGSSAMETGSIQSVENTHVQQEPETHQPSPSEETVVPVMPPPASPPVPTRRDEVNMVAEALKRVNTVDLENGKTPAPPQTLVSAGGSNGCSTVVMLDVGGVTQPVTVPLTPHQCKLAGLKVANEVSEPAKPTASLGAAGDDSPQGKPPADPHPSAEPSQPDEPDADLSEPSSKQMLRNLYMRFSRSQKRAPTAHRERQRDICIYIYIYTWCVSIACV